MVHATSVEEKGSRGVLILSPHLDDAALSVGGLLTSLASTVPVSVISFFTASSHPERTTRAARSFLAQAGWEGMVGDYYAQRRAEDITALQGVGVTPVHLGLQDALFRRRTAPTWLAGAQRLLPAELFHRYPTYRFDVALGRISRSDRDLRNTLPRLVSDAVKRLRPELVLAPLGVGRHVDHVLVRDAAAAAVQGAAVLAYYSDMPYARLAPADPRFVRVARLSRAPFEEGVEAKVALVQRYASQVRALYPDGVPRLPDELWWTADDDPAAVLARVSSPSTR